MKGQTIILAGPTQRTFAKEVIDAAPANAVVNVKEQTRSNAQNAKLWAMLSDVSRSKPAGRHWTTETWKAAFLHSLGWQMQFEQALDGQGMFPMGYRSSHMTVKQMADLITVILEYGDRHGVVWTEPEAKERAA